MVQFRPKKKKEYLKIVLDESKRLTKMVNDMLEMSKNVVKRI